MTSPVDTELLAPAPEPARLPALGSPEMSPAFLAKIKEILETLLGRRGGSNWDRAVTFRDLYEYGLAAPGTALTGGTGSDAGPASPVPGMPGSVYQQLMSQFQIELRNSAAFKELQRRIGGVDDLAMLPDEIRSKLSHALADVARQRQADIQTLEYKIQTGSLSSASRIIEITAALEQATAGVRQIDAAFADKTRALATSITQVTARLDDVGGVTIEEKFLTQADVNDGLLGQWSVKIQAGSEADPIIAGLALSVEDPVAGPGTSSMIFLADKFGFFTSGGAVMPFGIDGTTGNIYINGTLLVNSGGNSLDNLTDGMIVYVGSFASAPTAASYRVNDVYKNTTDGNSYILVAPGGVKSWSQWIAKGTAGTPGDDGQRGTVDIVASGSSWSNTTANNAISAAGYGVPVNRDRVTITNNTSFSQTRFYDSGTWLTISAWINGNMVVTGTLSASKVSAGTLSSVSINIGSSAGGSVFNVTDGGTSVSYRTLSGYNINCGNLADPTSPCITASGVSSSTAAGGSFTSGSGIGAIANGSTYDFYANGAGTNYGPFTGAHDALVPNDAVPEVGGLMVDVECVAARGFSNALFTMEKSGEPYQRGVRGPVSAIVGPLASHAPAAMVDARSSFTDDDGQTIYMPVMAGSYYEMADGYTLVAVNSVGEGQIKVCGEGGPISPDDLLVTSSIPGVAMRQNVRVAGVPTSEPDDLVRGFTVAKARVAKGQSVTFTNNEEIKVIPCIYLGG